MFPIAATSRADEAQAEQALRVEAVVHAKQLLARDSELVEVEIREIAALIGAGRIVIREAVPRKVGERMPEGREFPIEHADDARFGRMHDQIAEAEIAVRDRGLRKRFEERLSFLAQYDVLTGLPNRALFYDRLQRFAKRAADCLRVAGGRYCGRA